MHFEAELSHLHKAAELLQKNENKHWSSVIPDGKFPNLLTFHDTREYVRKVLAQTIENTADKENLKNVNELPDNHNFFWYQNKVNSNIHSVASHTVIDSRIKSKGEDYRSEVSPHPVESLKDRKSDNTTIARTKQKAFIKI